LRFVKGHGTGNDFVVLPDPDGDVDLTPALVAALCDRRRGVGADGVLRVVRSDAVPEAGPEVMVTDPDARWFMDYRNADGSVAEMCGNGIRVFGRFLVDGGYAHAGTLRIATRDGIKVVDVPDEGDVTVDMGVVSLLATGPVEVTLDGRVREGVAVSAGNPHVVVMLPSLDEINTLDVAPLVRPMDAFPAGTNVEFVERTGPDAVRMRVHERGVGETQSCGTGACAVVAAVIAQDGDATASYAVDVPGGRLHVRRCQDGRMLLTGPAVLTTQGLVRPEVFGAVVEETPV
jgi:diaminopimelate epimerase